MRPHYSISCWYLLSLVNTSHAVATDLDLHGEILHYLTGVSVRWSLENLLNGLTASGNVPMCLNPNNPNTRLTLNLLQHLVRLLAILANVLLKGEQVLPSEEQVAARRRLGSVVEKPSEVSSLLSAAMKKQSKASNALNENALLMGGLGPAFTGNAESLTKLTALFQSPNSMGCFFNCANYYGLYKSIKQAFHSFKYGSDLLGKETPLFRFYSGVLDALDRVLESLRYNEVSLYVQEISLYLSVIYAWLPHKALITSLRLMRALYGTNLTSLWDQSYADLTFSMNNPIETFQLHLESNIQYFEPLVMHSLGCYGNLFTIETQTALLRMVTQLIGLNINYLQLDSEGKFIDVVLQQVESMDQILVGTALGSYDFDSDFGPNMLADCERRVGDLLRSTFRFLQTLTYQSDGKATNGFLMAITQIFQLLRMLTEIQNCDLNLVLGHAMGPLVWDLFFVRDTHSLRQDLKRFFSVNYHLFEQQHCFFDLLGPLFPQLTDDKTLVRQFLKTFTSLDSFPKWISWERLFLQLDPDTQATLDQDSRVNNFVQMHSQTDISLVVACP
ncbi:Snail 2 [Cichlidogyrus casuarinus]|uniref:Snail 2 n=1 Tax=Cichlidogyrus casuarinus TaxID=1844966 RepID=A0ABD2Q551_9PLAT